MAEILSQFGIVAFLVFANAFFVAAEFSLVRVRRTRIESLIKGGNVSANVVKEAIEHLDDYISATQVGITLASLALGWVGEPFIADRLEVLFKTYLSAQVSTAAAHTVAFAIAFFCITFLHVVLGELLPKSLALQFPERVSLWVARPIKFCKLLFSPLIFVLNGTSFYLLKLLGIKPAEAHSLALSEEELLMLVTESKHAGVVTESEQQMLQNVFKFHDKTVREIMIPRPDVFALKLRADQDEIKAAFEQGYSRLPVYDKNLNDIKGIVYVKDLIYTMQDPKLIKLIDVVREAVFVPETMDLSALLRDFQNRKMHMAIVIDEFGDTAGLVTLEDVIEEIVGEIQDEYDHEPAQVERAGDGSIIFEAKTSMDRFKEVLPQVPLPEGSYESVGGLVLQLAGRLPREGEVFSHKGFLFRIAKREGRRLRRIVVSTERKESARLEPAQKSEPTPQKKPTAKLEPAIEIPVAKAGAEHSTESQADYERAAREPEEVK